jgi:hypothetical protein
VETEVTGGWEGEAGRPAFDRQMLVSGGSMLDNGYATQMPPEGRGGRKTGHISRTGISRPGQFPQRSNRSCHEVTLAYQMQRAW